MSLSLNHITHTAGNQKLWTLDYCHWLLPGETLTGYTLACSIADVVLDQESIFQGKRLLFRLGGGVAGETGTLTATVTTTKSETKIDTLKVAINAP